MVIQKEVEGTCFDSAFQTGSASLMTLNQYIGKVKSGEYARPIAYLRGLIKAGKKDEADAYKKKLPLYVAGGVMEGGRKLEHMVRYSACMVIDIDDSPIPVLELLRRAAELSYVKAGHVSPSGTGVKLFIMVDSDLKNHNLAFEIVKHRVEVDLPGVKVDVSGKDPNRGCFAGHDPNAFYKEESEAIEIPVADPEPQAASGHSSGSVCSGTRLSNYIDKYEQSNTFVAGNRHSYLVKLSSVLNNAGFSLYDAVSECVRRYGSADFPAAEVETTVNDIYRRYSASHGSCAFRPDGTSSVPKSAKSAKSATPFPKMAQKDAEYGECDDIELDNTLLPCFDENIYDHLPPLLTDILKCAYSRTDRDILLISSLTLLSSVSPGVKGSLGEHDYTPAFYSIITGGSGSGKGRIAALQRMLEPNYPYTSCMVDTEMETVLSMFSQDFGKYNDVLNKSYHHEPVGSSTKSSGSFMVKRPNLALLLSGTPAMLPRLIPSTENGLFSRILMYRIPGSGTYRPLTSADDSPAASEYFESWGQRVLDIGVFLDNSPTWVKFSDAQRKRLDRFFEREYYNVRSFGNEDMESTVLRYRLAIFRIGMQLTALRKGESGCSERVWTISDDDFATAFHLGKVCLQHASVVATSLQSAS